MKRKLLLLFCLLLASCLPADVFECTFARGQWSLDDFLAVKSPRWPNLNQWEQKDDHIVQKVPDEVTDLQLMEKLAPESYVSLCRKEKITVPKAAVITAEMSFDHRMAPLIVLAPEFGKDAQGNLEYRQHWEIVLFDKGINVWQHSWKDGKPSWVLLANLRTCFQPKTRYMLEVTVRRAPSGNQLQVRCNGHSFGCHVPLLPDSFYAGITACEGRNRFYRLKIDVPQPEVLHRKKP